MSDVSQTDRFFGKHEWVLIKRSKDKQTQPPPPPPPPPPPKLSKTN